MKRVSLLIALAIACSAIAAHKGKSVTKASADHVRPPADRPALVVAIVIDQFRADYLMRFRSRFLPAWGKKGFGGFQYLIRNGSYIPYGQYDLLQNMTGPGHATILTGSYPYQSGIPINAWFDATAGHKVFCAGDGEDVSPRHLIASTVGDELKNAGYPSRVISIALKDRAAVMLGGHRADLALWLDDKTFQWRTSKYYVPDGKLPEWVDALNKEIEGAKGVESLWEAEEEPTGFSAQNASPVLNTWAKENFSAVFPHKIALGTRALFFSPSGVDMTEAAAERAIDAYQLGRGKSTDLLALSLSPHDYLGHLYGPNSQEMEEMTVAEDRVLARLLAYLKKKVAGGLAHVVVVLTGDHGIPPNPDWLAQDRVTGGRLDENKLADEAEKVLEDDLGRVHDQKWISAAIDLNFYLNPKALASKKAERETVENALRAFLLKTEGIAQVVTYTDFQQRRFPPGMIGEQFQRTYFPGRSGDVMAIPRPYFFSGDETVNHLTGYSYDRTVPILFFGYRIRPEVEVPQAHVVDIAPTISYLTGTLPPDLSEGRVLREVIVH